MEFEKNNDDLKKNTETSLSFNEVLYYFPLIVYISFEIISRSMYAIHVSSYSNYLYFFCITLLVVRTIITVKSIKFDYRSITVTTSFIIMLILLIASSVKDLSIYVTIMLVISSYGISFRRTASIVFWVTLFCLIFIIFSAIFGFIINIVWQPDDRKRIFLGFRNALSVSKYTMLLTWLYLYLNRRELSFMQMVVLIFSNVLAYLPTRSRLNFYMAILSVLLVYFLKNKRTIDFIFKLAPIFPILSTLLSVYIARYYDYTNNFQYNLNTLLESRLSLGKFNLDEYGIHWLGNMNFTMNGSMVDSQGRSIIAVGTTYNYVDNLYLQYLIQYGILFMIVVTFLVTFVMSELKKVNSIVVLILFIMMLAVSFIDDGMLKLQYNTFILLGAEILWGSINTNTYNEDVAILAK